MLKRLILVAIFSFVFALAVPTASAMSPGSSDGGPPADFNFNGKTASDNIWIGLCVGASLQISQVSQHSCQHQLKQRRPQAQTLTQAPAPTQTQVQSQSQVQTQTQTQQIPVASSFTMTCTVDP